MDPSALKKLGSIVTTPRLLAVIALVAPALAAFAPKAIVIPLVLGGVICLPELVRVLRRMSRSLRIVAVLFSLLVAWAALSALWSIDPTTSVVYGSWVEVNPAFDNVSS